MTLTPSRFLKAAAVAFGLLAGAGAMAAAFAAGSPQPVSRAASSVSFNK